MQALSELQSTVLSLAKKFAQRQSVVLDAMHDLRPDLVMRYIDHTGTPDQWLELKRESLGKHQVGYWGENSEWAYILHGPGCRLTHIHTEEFIEWDFGDLNTFNVDWFINHLQSLLRQDVHDKELLFMRSILPDAERINELSEDEFSQQRRDLRKQYIEPVLEELCELGYLKKGSSYSYVIVGI